nr:PREDICTED: galectin-9 [Struthio camelus australis]
MDRDDYPIMFSMNFQCGTCQSPQADIALHFNPRFEKGGYIVAVNGKHFLEFRIPFTRVDTTTVSENMDLELISFEVTIPYSVSLPGEIYPTKNITISGTIPPSAEQFHVNLKAGDDIALHVYLRFREKVIIPNTSLNSSCGKEEHTLPSKMPLSRGRASQFGSTVMPQCFKVATNGQHQFDYKHQIPNLQHIDTLEVCRDVTLAQVHV